jgi:hypothetical protein
MSILSRDAFLSLAAVPLAKEEINIPALGGSVFVHELTAGERDAFEVAHNEADSKDFRARLTVYAARDEGGKPIFAASDIPALSTLPAGVLDPIVTAAVRLGKLSSEEIEALEKN